MLIRIYRVLSEADKKQYEELFSPYVKKTSGQFIYRLETEDIPTELEKVGNVYKEINDKPEEKQQTILRTNYKHNRDLQSGKSRRLTYRYISSRQ